MGIAAPSVRFCGGKFPAERCRCFFLAELGSEKVKKEKWHRKKMIGTQTVRKKKIQVKKWHLKKNDWNQKIGSKKVKKSGILEKWHGPKKRETKSSK